ncbi:MAG: hypothetical protein ACHQFW_02550 [Chitinophagales bacterium]
MSTFSKRLRYTFDNTMSKGPVALIIWLGIISFVLIAVAALILAITGFTQPETEELNFIEAAWQSLMRTLDSGTMGGDMGWGFRIVMLMVTLGGIFIVSTLIGVLSSGIEGKLDELRKGKSEVMENNYTLILGWSSKIYTIISELVAANANQRKPRIVILSNGDKVEMDDAIANNIGSLKNTKVICRSGDVTNPNDLNIVNPAKAKSIIILGKDDEASDFEIIKTILAITNNPNRKKEKYHIVAEMNDIQNYDVAKMVAKDEAELILTDDIVARIMVQTSRQSGLSIVYTELMDFGGDEIYFSNAKDLVGKKYEEILFMFESSCVMGLKKNGFSTINPQMDAVIAEGDEIIVMSEDDDTIVLSGISDYKINESAINNNKPTIIRKKEKILLLGWNPRVSRVIRELNNYVGSGSEIIVVANMVQPKELEAEKHENLTVIFKAEDTTDRKMLESLNVFGFDYVMLFSYKNEDLQKSDSITLITLLHLRDMSERENKDLNIVSEMLDLKNRELAEVTNADDFIVSDKMLSLLITQVSENKELMRVFEDILDEAGSEIYMKPIKDYVNMNGEINFYTLLESAKRKGQTAIGYRLMEHEHDAAMAYGVKTNPKKSDLIHFTADDKLIVLAED